MKFRRAESAEELALEKEIFDYTDTLTAKECVLLLLAGTGSLPSVLVMPGSTEQQRISTANMHLNVMARIAWQANKQLSGDELDQQLVDGFNEFLKSFTLKYNALTGAK